MTREDVLTQWARRDSHGDVCLYWAVTRLCKRSEMALVARVWRDVMTGLYRVEGAMASLRSAYGPDVQAMVFKTQRQAKQCAEDAFLAWLSDRNKAIEADRFRQAAAAY